MDTPPIGCTKDELDTPAVCIDLDAMDSNIRSLANACGERGIDWRPHSKCHKSTAIAQMQIVAGAVGVTCAKLGEAEVMAAGGVRDLLIANLIVGPQKVKRLVELRRQADPIVCVDHQDQLAPLSAAMSDAGLTLRVLVEVDIGLGRVGVAPGQTAVELARQAVDSPGIALAGVMGYEGHLLTVEDPTEKGTRIHAALDLLVETKNQLEQAGIPCPTVSCGGTGSYLYSVEHSGVTELQAGGAIFMDEFYWNLCQVRHLEFAQTVLTTVVSRPTPERAIIDAGRKTVNQEIHKPRVFGRNGIDIVSLSAEHGQLQLAPEAQDLKIGDRLELIPGYGDLTTVLHNEMYGFRNGRLEVILPVEARGKIR
jgi:D-serine deaminase-like pyridoxal phosphate-dependent protein